MRFSLASLIWVIVCAQAITASAQWPGWRGDGSGITHDSTLPITWSTHKNVRWSRELPGTGNSSPIVFQDRVVVTTSASGVVHELPYYAAIGAMFIALGGTLLFSIMGTDRNQAHRRGRRVGSAALLTLLCLAAMAAAAAAMEITWQSSPALAHRIVGKPWLYHKTADKSYKAEAVLLRPWYHDMSGAPASDNARVPWEYFVVGAAGALGVYVARKFSRQPADSDAVRRWPASLGMLLPVMLCGWLAAVMSTAVFADFEYRASRTWFRSADILCIAWVVAVAAAPHTFWRIAFLGAGGTALALIGRSALFPWAFDPKSQFQGFFLVALGAGVLMTGWRRWSPVRSPQIAPVAGSITTWPLASFCVVAAASLFFVGVNVIQPRQAVLRNVLCFDRRSGDFLWETTCAAEPPFAVHRENTLASPTPVTDGESIFVRFPNTGTYCLDPSGKIRWRNRDQVQQSIWGEASSPILWNDLLILNFDTGKQTTTVALDKHTGKKRWTADRDAHVRRRRQEKPDLIPDTYCTPLIIDQQNQSQLLVNCCMFAVAYDPATGDELWSLDHSGDQIVPSPVVAGELIVLPGGAHGSPFLGAIRLTSEADPTVPAAMIWEDLRSTPTVASPVVVGDKLFSATLAGILVCRDVRTGERLWKQRLPGEIYASPVAVGDRLYFCCKNGVTAVYESSGDGREIARNDLGEAIYASPAIADGSLFIRTASRLYCLANP